MQALRRAAGDQRPAAVEHEGNEDEADAEHAGLERDRSARGVDELRQECEEEQRRLGVEHVHDDAVPEDPPVPRVGRRASGLLATAVALEQGANAEIDEVRGAGVADDVERGGRGGEHGREAHRRGRDVHESAHLDAGRRHQPGHMPVAHAARDDVDHRRTGDQHQQRTGRGEDEERVRLGHAGPY